MSLPVRSVRLSCLLRRCLPVLLAASRLKFSRRFVCNIDDVDDDDDAVAEPPRAMTTRMPNRTRRATTRLLISLDIISTTPLTLLIYEVCIVW